MKKEYAFGVDVGGTTVKMGLFTTEGQLLESWQIPTVKTEGGKQILPDVAAAVLGKIQERGLKKEQVAGIGMGIPGPVLDNGTVLRAVNLGWGVFNVQEALSELTGLPAKAGNDANVAALGEMWKGGGDGCPEMVMVTLGTGVGGGIIVGGRILCGENGAAGEIGHLPVFEPEDEPEVCGCGKRGCLEQYASATGVVLLARRYLAAHPDLKTVLPTDAADKAKAIPDKGSGTPKLSSRVIFNAAAAGDAAALAITDELYRILGRGLAMVSAVVNPRRYVIGGGVSNAGEVLTEGIKKYHSIYAFPAARDVDFVLAALGNKAGIYGGVKLLLG